MNLVNNSRNGFKYESLENLRTALFIDYLLFSIYYFLVLICVDQSVLFETASAIGLFFKIEYIEFIIQII